MIQLLVQESYMSKLLQFRGMYDHSKSLSFKAATRADKNDSPNSTPPTPKSKTKSEPTATDANMMKERFSKLLLGEDMSGGGKGVSSALALSNAITNLAASVFGEHRCLEPLAPDRRERWRKEVDWLLSVTDYIVEFAPAQQKTSNGIIMEVMVWKQRKDLMMNIPALRKLDTMLLECLESFKGTNEFYYSDEEGTNRKVQVPPNCLSDMSRKFLQRQKDCVTQVLKAAMAINAQVLSEMEIPESYIETLPKNGRASLGDSVYKSITVEVFDPDQFLFYDMDLSTEHKILDLKNKMEASIVIWKRKMISKSGWGSGVSLEKREVFEERAETILLLIKLRYPGIAQSSLDISKIQYNKDVGQAILESYSRVLGSLAYMVLSCIEDVQLADRETKGLESGDGLERSGKVYRLNYSGDGAMTLSDFMGWNLDQEDGYTKDGEQQNDKVPSISINRTSYVENLGELRSPTARH